MKVACIQLSSGENYNKNFKEAIFYINQAIKKKVNDKQVSEMDERYHTDKFRTPEAQEDF